VAGRIVSVAVSDQPGLRKRAVGAGRLIANHGLEGDRHADGGPRQISLLDAAVADAMRSAGIPVEPGALGENLQVAGLPLDGLRPGTRLRVGPAVLEITQPRPACKSLRELDPRALKALVGHSGQMARVVSSGEVRSGDPVETLDE
jgi:MOSC domain-containing protein YiiM